MIKLSDNKTALVNLNKTIEAIETLEYLIKEYSVAKAGPAYCKFNYVSSDHSEVQINRAIMVVALKSQRQHLVDYLEKLGIDANN